MDYKIEDITWWQGDMNFMFGWQEPYRVRTGPGKPGKSWNFVMAFSRTGKSWKKATGHGKSWKSF